MLDSLNKAARYFICIAIVMCISSMCASAGEYTTEIEGFTYNGYYIPAYDGDAYEYVNDNNPCFSMEELSSEYENYGSLDGLGRCTSCSARLSQKLMPTEDRGSISSIYPTGWVQNKYDTSIVSGGYIYNRCHLLGYQLTGVDNVGSKKQFCKQDLITGTRYLNINGMVGWENDVASYIRNTGNHVAYRVTPVFDENDLLAEGVLMEAESVEDDGAAINFCIFCYNVQPGIAIDYSTGDNRIAEFKDPEDIKPDDPEEKEDPEVPDEPEEPVKEPVSIKTVTLSDSTYIYNGKVRKPTVTVRAGTEKLTKGEDYTVTYSKGCKNVGKYTVTVKGTGDYKGTLKKTYTIIPKTTYFTKASAGKKKVALKWAKQSVQTTGYQIRYSTSSKFSSYKTAKVTKNTTVSKTVKSLKSKKKYYFKIRTYKVVGDKTYYGNWSKVKTTTVK